MTMNTIADFYRPILTSKWFYLAIAATVLSYIGLNESLSGFARDYVQFGPAIASFHIPLLRFFFLSFRYCVPLAEIAILSDAWYAPVVEPKFADTLPAGTTWEQICLKFLDDDRILILAGQYRREVGYGEMGFTDTRGRAIRPNGQWQFLKVLAKMNGEIAIADPEARDAYKKQKQLLSSSLKKYFRIDYDPFHPYRDGNSYRIKMTLIPPEEAKAGPEIDKPGLTDFADDIREAYEEQTRLR